VCPAAITSIRLWGSMKDYQASIEKLRSDAAEAALIRDLATYRTNARCSPDLRRAS